MANTDDRAYSKSEQDRREKREKLIAQGRGYDSTVKPTTSIEAVVATHSGLAPDTITTSVETLAGRVMFFRSSGKIAFATLQSGSGQRIQLMLMAQELGVPLAAAHPELLDPTASFHEEAVRLGKLALKDFAREVDLGDFIAVTGAVATSIKGELSLRVTSWVMATKSVRPLPFLHAELSDEMRVRQPYANLITSAEARRTVRMRSQVMRWTRRYFETQNFLEIETPILTPVHGGALARPFKTHVNALDQEFSLRIALELNLKKAVVGGLERVFELGKAFRNEGLDSTHNPEFTMLEAYAAYEDMHSMAEHFQCLLRSLTAQVGNISSGEYTHTLADGLVLDFAGDFRWLSVYDAASAVLGTSITPDTAVDELRTLAASVGVAGAPEWSAGKWVMEVVGELVEPTLIQPTFLFDWPAEAQPLAARDPDDARKVLAWDLIINGVEVGSAFTELVDPVVQREILTAQSLIAAGGDPEAMALDEDFLRALELGAPPMGGMGVGMDRLVMLFTGVNIRESLLFPLVKKEDFSLNMI